MNIRIRRLVLTPMRDHYDKIIVVGALILLLVISSWLVVEIDANRSRLDQQRAKHDNQLPLSKNVQTVSRDKVRNGLIELAKPLRLSQSISNITLLVPEERVSCPNVDCRKPIPFKADRCPFCNSSFLGGVAGVTNTPPEKDSDDDGMMDWYEDEYKLNKLDNRDAKIDADGDGYTNMQEFEAGKELKTSFSPIDKDSVPPAWWGGNLVVSDAKALEFNLRYMSSMPVGTNWLHVINEVGGQTHSKQIGESVAGFKIVKYEEKFVWVIPENMTRQKVKKNVSELTLESRSGVPVVLIKEEPKLQWERSATIYYLPGARDIAVREGEIFDVGPYKYQVKDIDAGGRKVLLFDPTFQREVWIMHSLVEKMKPEVTAPTGKDAKEVPAAAANAKKPAVGGTAQPAFDPFETR
ncbi:MAG: hypothetical protein WCL44_09255 [bacterium]